MTSPLVVPNAIYLVVPCLIAFRVIDVLVRRFVPVPSNAENSWRKQWTYHNTLVSIIHSCISSGLSLFSLYDEPAMLTDMIGIWTKMSFYAVCFSTGYFIHDLIELVRFDLRNSLGLLFHHVLCVSACLFTTFSKVYLAFPTCFLLLEINSVPLHLRRLMRFHQMDKSNKIYRFNVVMLLLTFVVFRFIPVAWMENFVITHARSVYFPHFLFGFFGIGGMLIVNVILFITLCKAEFGGKPDKQGKKEDK